MKRTSGKLLLALALAASLSALADDDNRGRDCRLSTLKGLYGSGASGVTIVNGLAVPKAVIQFTRFYGDGTFTVPAGSLSVNGVISHIPNNVVGTYTLAADCSGTYQFAPPAGPTFDLIAAPDGDVYWLLQTGPGLQVQQNKAERLSR